MSLKEHDEKFAAIKTILSLQQEQIKRLEEQSLYDQNLMILKTELSRQEEDIKLLKEQLLMVEDVASHAVKWTLPGDLHN